MRLAALSRLISVSVGLVVGSAAGCGDQNNAPSTFTPGQTTPLPPAAANDGGGTGGTGDSGAIQDAEPADLGPPGEVNGNATIESVLPSAGCNAPAPPPLDPSVLSTIPTMGTKPADAADTTRGPWTYDREYRVVLPVGYIHGRAYPLVFQASGCGGNATTVHPLNNNVYNTVIRVGVSPPPDQIGHATNPGQKCFDDWEGDDSVDWVLYENLYDRLAATYCIDRNRVFASGFSNGGIFANELACKYAGDAARPVRGVLSNEGNWPVPAFAPAAVPPFSITCTNKPLAGMWVWEMLRADLNGDPTPINRAMRLNGCPAGSNYANAQLENFPIGGGNPDGICRKIRDCDPLYPLVICYLVPGDGRSSHDNLVNPGFATFIKQLSAIPAAANSATR